MAPMAPMALCRLLPRRVLPKVFSSSSHLIRSASTLVDHRYLMSKEIKDQSTNPLFFPVSGNGEATGTCWASAVAELMEALYYLKYQSRVTVCVDKMIKNMPTIYKGTKGRLAFISINGVETEEGRKLFITNLQHLKGREQILSGLRETPIYGRLIVDRTFRALKDGIITSMDVKKNMCQLKRIEVCNKEHCPFRESYPVFKPEFCQRCGFYGTETFHAVVLTGLKYDASTYYLEFKNSWGVNWGNEGYGKIEVRKREMKMSYDRPHGVLDIFRSAWKMDVRRHDD